MLENSKLSNRFKNIEKKEIKIPTKLTFPQKSSSVEMEKKSPLEQSEPKIEVSTIEENIKQELLTKIETIPVWGEYSEEKQKELIKSFVENKILAENLTLSEENMPVLIENLYSSVIGFGPLEYLINQENVSTIFVNGENSVYIEIGGRILNTEMLLSEQQLKMILKNISMLSGIKISNIKNVFTFKYNNLSISIINKPISVSGVNILIRKNQNLDLNSILNSSFVSREVLDFIINAVSSKKNIVFSGDINSGKTSFLEALINSVIPKKRVVLLEKEQSFNTISSSFMHFIANKKSEDFEDIIEYILKLSPEYIITDLNSSVPEFSEIKGYLTTLRADSVDFAISKLVKDYVVKENMPEKLAKATVLSNYDYIIQINKLEDGKRCVTSIVELTPARSVALSVKTISKFENGEYTNAFPQPLTSIRAGSLISEAGSMSSRFYQK